MVPSASRVIADEPPAVRVAGLHKRYGDVTALVETDLTVRPGESFTQLGPSGSGKTTLLRLIAGFERPDGGRIELAGQDVTQVPPFARDVNTVFQDYALFPHMTTAENIEYGLKVHRVGKQVQGPGGQGARHGPARRPRRPHPADAHPGGAGGPDRGRRRADPLRRPPWLAARPSPPPPASGGRRG